MLQKNGIVLDPFVGSGTVLYEAGRLNLEVYGTEINPAAYKLSRIYRLINCKEDNRKRILALLETIISKDIDKFIFIVEQNPQTVDIQLKKYLIDSLSSLTDIYEHEILEALIILLDFYKNDITVKKIYDKFYKIKNIILGLLYSMNHINSFNSDARNIPLSDNSVDIIITSPPYINVFNYHQNYRASVEALGWNILNVAKSEIGSNRKNRGNRILTVIQYCIDIAQCFYEWTRILKKSGRIVMIVGRESNIRKTPFYNSMIISQLGINAVGLRLIKRQERVFKNKFGTMIYEDILHFLLPTKKIDETNVVNEARNIARRTLVQTLSYAPTNSRVDIESAIDKIDYIQSSPIYKPNIDLIFK